MIGLLQGKVFGKEKNGIILLVGGVGYRVFVSPILLAEVRPEALITLFTYTNVRDDAIELYGFADRDTLALFQQLLTVSGVGPKTALAVLSIATAKDIRSAIGHEDPTLLMKVSGIGRKTAERIILELKGKVESTGEGEALASGDSEVIDALVGLGYKVNDVRDTLKKIGTKATGTNDRIKAALKIFSGA